VNGGDVPVRQSGNCAGLAQKARAKVLVSGSGRNSQSLYGDAAPEDCIFGKIHDPHATFA
jgi:hypothetical protein